MANKLYIWSNIPGQWYKGSTENDAAGRSAADSKAGNKVRVEEVKSIEGLRTLFVRLANQSDVWNAVSFYTHGSGGSIALGADAFWHQSLSRFENQNLDQMFAKDCVITFEGCKVAEGAMGEYFLTQVASTFLLAKGGSVRGNTNVGLGYWGGESSVHPLGTWVSANLGPGGSLRLENVKHLRVDTIQSRISSAESIISAFRDRAGGQDKQNLEQMLERAKFWGTQGLYARYQTCLQLDKIEKEIDDLAMSRVFSDGI